MSKEIAKDRSVEKVGQEGWIKRDKDTGRFVEVRTEKGSSRASAITISTLGTAAERRQAALKRLADR